MTAPRTSGWPRRGRARPGRLVRRRRGPARGDCWSRAPPRRRRRLLADPRCRTWRRPAPRPPRAGRCSPSPSGPPCVRGLRQLVTAAADPTRLRDAERVAELPLLASPARPWAPRSAPAPRPRRGPVSGSCGSPAAAAARHRAAADHRAGRLPRRRQRRLLTGARAGGRALARAPRDWRGSASVLVDLEGHGREEHRAGRRPVPHGRLVHHASFPVRLDPGPVDLRTTLRRRSDGPARRSSAVKEQLRAVPGRRGRLRAAAPPQPGDRAALAALPRPQIGFNYLGRFGVPTETAWTIDAAGAADARARVRPRHADRPVHALELNAFTHERPDGPCAQRHLGLALTDLFDRGGRAASWPTLVRRAGRARRPRAPSAGAGGHTPSDLPLVDADPGRRSTSSKRTGSWP